MILHIVNKYLFPQFTPRFICVQNSLRGFYFCKCVSN